MFEVHGKYFAAILAKELLDELKNDCGGRVLLPVWGGLGYSKIVGYKIIPGAIALEGKKVGAMYYYMFLFVAFIISHTFLEIESDLTDLCQRDEKIVNSAADTIIECSDNDESGKSTKAVILGCGGTGKLHFTNMVIDRVRVSANDYNIVQIAVAVGAAASDVQGSKLHKIFGLREIHQEYSTNE